MSIARDNPVLNRYKQLYSSAGKAALHYLYPNDFEVYMCALELVSAKGQVLDYFAFPIMPNSIKIGESSLASINKSAGGLVIVDTPTFVPKAISINGNFGRRFRLLIGRQQVDAAAISFSDGNGGYSADSIKTGANQLQHATFDSSLKTGYGCFSILRSIIRGAKAVDNEGNPNVLYFYNPAMGESYMVKVINFDSDLDNAQHNMIHHYNLQLQAIAPVETARSGDKEGSLTKTMQYATLGQGLNAMAVSLKQQLNSLL